MYLILEVTGANAAALGGARRAVFSVDGGRIGRAVDSDMVLPGAGVHRHHATVRFINGVFFIESVGTNGIAINNADVILPRNEPYPLKQGDTLYIDEFEIAVAVSAQAPPAAPAEAPVAPTPQPPERAPLIDAPLASAEDLDPLRHLAARSAAHTTPPAVPPPAWNHSSALEDHFTPPPAWSGGSAAPVQTIPEDWDKTTFNRAQLEPAPPTMPPPAPVRTPVMPQAGAYPAMTAGTHTASPAGTSLDWDAFLRSAGVDPAQVPPETSAMLGDIMRSVVQGLIEVLRARSEIKNEFRMAVTQVRVSENNPLKFAANAEDALLNLFGRRNPAYLPPREAFEDALDDVRFHQLAMLAGVRAGFDHLMSRFDPQQLEESFTRQGRRGLFGGGRAQYWEMYSERYREMAADPDETFRRLFGEEFARAYERQLATLKRRGAQG